MHSTVSEWSVVCEKSTHIHTHTQIPHTHTHTQIPHTHTHTQIPHTHTHTHQELDEDQSLSSQQRKQLLEDRKRELHSQQRSNENDHLQILRTIAEHETVDFRQRLLQDRQSLEKALLQEVKEGR